MFLLYIAVLLHVGVIKDDNRDKTRDHWVLGCSGIGQTVCKQSAPHSRQITTPYQSIFTDRMLFLMPRECKQLNK